MYESHFGFRERPFRSTPDVACYYPATGHEGAVARLLEGLAEDEGLLLLTGDAGTGKTLLCHCLMERLDGDIATVFCTHGHLSTRLGLLQAILYDLSLPHEGRGEQELRLSLIDHLLNIFSEGRRSLLILDEAQHLTTEVLEELRLLVNLEGRHSRAVQVILASQPSFVESLRSPELAVFNQRLAVRSKLEPLAPAEAADYLQHQIRTAGGRPETIMTDEAVELIANGSRGIPRLINQTAHQALRLACAANMVVVDAEAALEAYNLLGLGEESRSQESGVRSQESLTPDS